jgi:hypothetical protein
MGHKTINARAETVATTPSFREPFKSQRGLVSEDGFYAQWLTRIFTAKRCDKLYMFTNMRSNDTFWCLPHDFFPLRKNCSVVRVSHLLMPFACRKMNCQEAKTVRVRAQRRKTSIHINNVIPAKNFSPSRTATRNTSL